MKILASLLLICALPLAAQEVTDEYTEHVVAPGDTLEGITIKYLGTDFLWRENWKLNPPRTRTCCASATR